MIPDVDNAHVTEGKALLLTQFKGRTNIEGLLSVFLRRVQELEDAFWELLDARILDTATNAQLESLGGLAGEKRNGRSDAEFRVAIKMRIRINRSKGRIVDVIDVAKLVNAAPRVTELRHLNFLVELYNQDGERTAAELLDKTRAASSYGVVLASDLPEGSFLSFDDAVSPIAGCETFSDYGEEFP